ncbi:hypothetical protein [Burkholderia ubonensis]|uniref:hypothetical protein n=1 Tax=Burkholderia ubonensis TaxID=101571 RepID=UPI000AD39C25|nr:hypothetical protein [Burkholderia ubonensis]
MRLMPFEVKGLSAVQQPMTDAAPVQPPAPATGSHTPRSTPAILAPLERSPFRFSGTTAFKSQVTEVGAVVAENSFGRISHDLGARPDANLCYPNISSCLTVTGLSRRGSLRGGHLTTPEGLKREDMQALSNAMGAQDCKTFVVAGPIADIKARTEKSECSTRKEMAAQLKAASPNAEVRFLDTSDRRPPYNIYVRREPPESGDRLQVHITDQSGTSAVGGVVTAAVPRDASLPDNAVAISDADLVNRDAGKPSWKKMF